jgi:uncharacterized protein YjiS (DUF1127 family)
MSALNAATITKQLNARALATHSNAMSHRQGRLMELIMRFYHWRRIRRDEAWLQRQPDYLLRDIGLEREEISRTLRGRGSGLY